MQTTTVSTRMACVSAACFSDDVRSVMYSLAALAGIDINIVNEGQTLPPALLFFEEIVGAHKKIRPYFHPAYEEYFPHPCEELDVETDAGDILELLICAAMTERGTIIGVVGASGGVGATTLACALSLELSDTFITSLVDCDPLTQGIDHVCGIQTKGLRWHDIQTQQGALVPGRLAHVLPCAGKLRVLTGDERGGVDFSSEALPRAAAALSRTHDITLLDMSRQHILDNSPLLQWCDEIIIVFTAHPRSMHAAHLLLERIPQQIKVRLVVNQVSTHAQASAIAHDMRIDDIHPVRFAKTLEGNLNHGIPLREQKRTGMRRDIAKIAAHYMNDKDNYGFEAA